MAAQQTTQFAWLVRREFWEHKAILIVPLVVLGLLTVTDIVAMIRGSAHLGLATLPISNMNEATISAWVELIFLSIGSVFALAMGAVSIFYLLDSLYSERRDRSILFWKSLPITDSATVLSKFFTGVVAIPVISLIATLIAYVILLAILSVGSVFSEGVSLAGLWNPVNIARAAYKSVALTFVVQLWFLPVFAWLLICSAFARKTPILFAFFIPMGIELAEHLAFNRSRLSDLLDGYFSPFIDLVKDVVMSIVSKLLGSGQASLDGTEFSVGSMMQVFTEPVLYGGLLVAGAFVGASIWWRRNRSDHT